MSANVQTIGWLAVTVLAVAAGYCLIRARIRIADRSHYTRWAAIIDTMRAEQEARVFSRLGLYRDAEGILRPKPPKPEVH